MVAVLLAATVIAACGSTNSRKASPGRASDGKQDAATTAQAAGEPVAAESADASTGEATAGRRGSRGSGARSGGESSQSGAAAAAQPAGPGRLGPVRGRGFTDTTLLIGIETLEDFSGEAFGASAVNAGNTQREAQAVVDHLNATGGIAGRKVRPVYRSNNIVGPSWDGEAQATCAAFTDDAKVFAGVSSLLQSSLVLPNCMSAKGTPLVNQGRVNLDGRYYVSHRDLLYAPGWMSTDRWGAGFVDRLAAGGFFDPESVIGIARYDSRVLADLSDRHVKPALARRGLKVAEESVLTSPPSAGGLAEVSAQASSAILRMRSRGVNHVLILDEAGTLAYFFIRAASGSGWRPRWGLNEMNILGNLAINESAETLRRSIAVGWRAEVGREHAPNAVRDACRAIERKAGVEIPTALAEEVSYSYCEGLLFLRAALERAPSLSPAGLATGVSRLAGTFASPLALRTRFVSARGDGGAALETLAYEERCDCYRPAGPLVPVD